MLAEVLNSELIGMLVAHLKWEEEYKAFDAAIKESANEEVPEGEEARNVEADQQKLEEMKNRIKQSIRNIVRYCYDKREEFDKLKELIGHKKSGKILEFSSLFFHQFEIFRQKMTTSKEEEDSKQEQMKLLDEKVKELSNRINLDKKAEERKTRKTRRIKRTSSK